MLNRIFLIRLRTDKAFAAATLCAIGAYRGPFDVAVVTDRNDHRLFGDQVFQIDLSDLFAADFGAPLIAILSLELLAIGTDNREDVLLIGKNALIFGDFLKQLLVFAAQLFLLQIDQLAERHPQNRVGLDCRERIGVANAALLL